ncbi:MAG: hypothetical protein KatS3mg115_2616 [Candidatus Poribacteria bacterium]|nr:MAG: hypothetical protein KatS3mg115_2616 [Candidatus Poribacteria bacterium]
MPLQTEEDVYRHMGTLLLQLAQEPEVRKVLADSGLVFRFRLIEPEAVITVDARPGVNAVRFGEESDPPPTGELRCKTTTAHRIWLGRANVMGEIMKGRIDYRGPLSQLQRLLPLLRAVVQRYPEHLRALGAEDLLNP